MASCLNEVNLIGELANDPEIRQMGEGRLVCNLRVLTTNTWRDRNSGEQKTRPKYTTVVIFDQDSVMKARGLKTGARVTVRGELQDRKWQDNSGQDKWVTEVVVQGLTHLFIPHMQTNAAGRPSEGQLQPTANKSKFPGRASHAKGWGFDEEDLEDSVPFTE